MAAPGGGRRALGMRGAVTGLNGKDEGTDGVTGVPGHSYPGSAAVTYS